MASLPVIVFGAAGHTGRFVVEELRRRGRPVIVAGRDAAKLAAVRGADPAFEPRVADVADPAALDRALHGASAVINCAGPFLDTAAPVIEAALRAGIHYLDVTAEQPSARATYERYAQPAQAAGVVVVPAMGFYGGLGDLLATAAAGAWAESGEVDEIAIAVALDSWQPTLGTRRTGQRNTAQRLVVSDGRLVPLADPAPRRHWELPAPFGAQEVVGVSLTEIIAISQHLRSREIHSFMNLAPLADLRNSETPPPSPTDDRGRSAQMFLVDVVVRRQGSERRARARGRDIYAITAPLVVEALDRILDGRAARTGAAAPGELFDARDFLAALGPDSLTVEYA